MFAIALILVYAIRNEDLKKEFILLLFEVSTLGKITEIIASRILMS